MEEPRRFSRLPLASTEPSDRNAHKLLLSGDQVYQRELGPHAQSYPEASTITEHVRSEGRGRSCIWVTHSDYRALRACFEKAAYIHSKDFNSSK